MRICASCGLIAPAAATACSGCARPLGADRREAAGEASGARWAQIRCELECRVCGRRAPQNQVDADGVICCALCATEQVFDVTAWTALFDEAHAVVDLAGQNEAPEDAAAGPKEGRRERRRSSRFGEENPHRNIGVLAAQHAFRQERSSTGNRLHASIGPGHPLCERCREPLSIETPAPRVIATKCPGCHDQATFTAPEALAKLCPDLVGLIAAEHRSDHPSAVTRAVPGEEAAPIRCPTCGAGLPLQGRARVVTCAYCNNAARIPGKLLDRGAGEPEIEASWALLRGPSKARTAIERLLESEQRRAGEAAARREQAPRYVSESAGAVAIRGAKKRAAVFSLACVAAIGIVYASHLRLGEKHEPRWFSASYVVVLIVLLLFTVFGQVVFGTPMNKGSKGWDPGPEREQRIAIFIAFGVLAGAAVLGAVLWE